MRIFLLLKFLINILGAIFNLLVFGGLASIFLVLLLVSYYGNDLPSASEIENYKPETLSRIYDTDGNVLGIFGEKNRIYTPISDIPELVKNAFISAEDKNFYIHPGYDPVGLLKAITDVFRGKKLRGASTITQQVMKNFLLSRERTGKRKIKELILAARIERVLSKDEILNVYLNEIYLGQRAYGVTAASITYFNKRLDELNIAEAAYLAALPKAPSFYHPIKRKKRSILRRNFVLRELRENGYISLEEETTYKQFDLVTKINEKDKELSLEKNNSYFNDQINRLIKKKYPNSVLESEGLTIMATLDPNLQEIAEKALQGQLLKYDKSIGIYRGPIAKISFNEHLKKDKINEALDELGIVKPLKSWNLAVVKSISSSSIEIYVQDLQRGITPEELSLEGFNWIKTRLDGSRKINITDDLKDIFAIGDVIFVQLTKNLDSLNSVWKLQQTPEIQGAFMVMEPNTGKVLAMQGGFSYGLSKFNRASQAKRQPGSAFKPFVYLAALENGFFPNSIFVDAPISVGLVDGVWRPKNSNNEWFGASTLRKGLEHSRNLMTVRLAKEVGMTEVAKYAKLLGIYNEMPDYLSYSLGAGETTLLDLVQAYSVLANGGLEIEPTFFKLIQNRYGNTIYKHGFLRCLGCTVDSFNDVKKPVFLNLGSRLIDPVSVYQINSMLQGVVKRGTAAKTVGALKLNIAGKTGTTNDAKDLWFIGYTPEIVVGCFMGYDSPRSLGVNASGGKYCGEAFTKFYKNAFGKKSIQWKVPNNTKFVAIDYDTGNLLDNIKSNKVAVSELYRIYEQPADVVTQQTHDGGLGMGQDLLILDEKDNKDKTYQLRRSYGAITTGGQY